jgi:PTS system glucose-specific IIA component
MKGEGFKNYVNTGDSVKTGDKLMSFDTNLIKEKAKSTLSPFVITNLDAVESMKFFYGNAHKSSTVAVISLK